MEISLQHVKSCTPTCCFRLFVSLREALRLHYGLLGSRPNRKFNRKTCPIDPLQGTNFAKRTLQNLCKHTQIDIILKLLGSPLSESRGELDPFFPSLSPENRYMTVYMQINANIKKFGKFNFKQFCL